MRLLLDSHVFLIAIKRALELLPSPYRHVLSDEENPLFVSAASLWEIALKWQLGKLPLDVPPSELPQVASDLGVSLLAVDPEHAVHRLTPLPKTRDPFDRMLLAQCQLENLRLVTLDRKLVEHPLAWKPAPA